MSAAYFRLVNIVFSPNDFHYPEDQIRKVILHTSVSEVVGLLLAGGPAAEDVSLLCL